MPYSKGMGLITALCLAACLAPGSTKYGLALGVPVGGTAADLFNSMRQQIRLGLDGQAPSIKWDECESQSWKPLNDIIGGMGIMGQDALLTISTLDTVKRRLPQDVANLAWDDPKLIARFDGFLKSVAAKLPSRVKWVSLGNEVDGYLSLHPSELTAYKKFVLHGRDVLREVKPGLAVGVTVECTDGMKHPEILRAMQEGMDITVFTIYPLDGMTVMKMTELPRLFDFMLGVAGPRPLLLQEIGYPASPLVGSSEDMQSEFITAVFKQIDLHQDHITLACFFMQMDFPPDFIKMFEKYYGLEHPQFAAFLGTLGLFDYTGKPRKAWRTFSEEMLKRHPVIDAG